MLENWAWDKKVLDSFAADYRDPSKKIPQQILEPAQGLQAGHRRHILPASTRLSACLDLALHTQIHADNAQETVPLSNKIIGGTFFPEPPDTAFVAYFGHLMGYDAGYYGYAWADAIAADMATVFANAPDGFFDERGRPPAAQGNLRGGRLARRGNLD